MDIQRPVSAQDLSVLFRQHTNSIAMSNILDVAKAAEAKKTKLEKFLALESLA